ncbi:hypothetical protein CR155_05935 [Pollutimonas nitritireducens]|uniref:Uncharacterized protein n=1 Tax=Pollutimonas nitritireducens TaxID=2045209 RepID=A0A2N4UJ07_9BURK|nr:hypothetical protein [Pollutimonas nitritireducens]PLC54990.1 hypothetical protein CR155_05935 [Pollutimonas nitritireducens]
MTTKQWGYERADCRGSFALSLFLDDMERLIEHYTGQAAAQPEAVIFQAQAAANKLVQAYERNARNTTAFTKQSIEIKSVVDAEGALLLVPIFSTGLKQKLVELLKRSNETKVH